MSLCGRWHLVVTLLAAAALLPWQTCISTGGSKCCPVLGVRMVAGQGLAVSSEQLGAGEAATATQLEYFEDALNIATTGGRGRGGRGGTGNLAAAAFTDVDRLQHMQRGIYYLAAAAKSFPSCQHKYGWAQRRAGDTLLRADCNNFVPSTPRDQVGAQGILLQNLQFSINRLEQGGLCNALSEEHMLQLTATGIQA